LGGSTSFFCSFLLGSIGLGFFVYGKKQGRLVPLLTGIALMIFPYFITDPLLMVMVGALLIALPYFIRD
jgi:hypothetical protein